MRQTELHISSPPSEPLAATVHTRSQGGRFFLGWWASYLIFSPVYVFASGLPQPADALLAIMIAVLATGYALRVPVHHDLYLAGAAFLAWVAVINWAWWSQYHDSKFLLSSVYYVYNFAIVISVLALFNKLHDDFLAVTRVALIVAVVMELTVIFVVPDAMKGMRSVGTFNNPNQLGYWTLLAAVCYLVTKRESRLGWFDLLMLCGLGYTAVLSLSKATMLSFLALICFAFWFQGVATGLKLILGSAVALAITVVLLQPALLAPVVSEGMSARVLERFEDIGGQDDDTPAGRGYDRIWLYPEYVFIGAGEGAFDRFAGGMLAGNEMHSTLGTILFSYGLPGFALFLLLLWLIFRHAPMRHVMYLVPIVLYGLTHQGLRASLFWVFLALVFCLARERRAAALPALRSNPGIEAGFVPSVIQRPLQVGRRNRPST